MQQTFDGSCHCGRVRFRVRAELDQVRECDCSICARRGALIHRVPEADFALLTPLGELTVYRWGTMTGADYFCPVCGILPFRRPAHPSREETAQGVQRFDGWAVNARCLEGVDLEAIPRIRIEGRKISYP